MDEQASGGGGGGGGGELNDGAEWEQVWERKYSLRKKNKEEKKNTTCELQCRSTTQ